MKIQQIVPLLALCMALVSQSRVDAATIIMIQADAGDVESINAGSPEESAGFLIGEPLTFEFTFDLATPDSNPTTGIALYEDMSATLKLIGQTSNASLSYADGLRITLLNSTRIEFRSIVNAANDIATLAISDDIDYLSLAGPFFSNVDDLPTVFDDLLATPFPEPNDFSSGTTYWTGTSSAVGMVVGAPPNPSSFVRIPEPPTLALIGLCGLLLSFRQALPLSRQPVC